MKKLYILTTVLLCSLFFYSCLEMEEPEVIVDAENMTLENAIIPEDFQFSTQSLVVVKLTVPEFLKSAVVTLCAYQHGVDSMQFARVAFNDNGYFESEYSIQSRIDSIMLVSSYLGLVKEIIVPIENNIAEFDYRPLYQSEKSASTYNYPEQLKSGSASTYTYMGNYSSSGVPSYLTSQDNIQQNLLDDINASLPEGKRLPQSHPEYLEAGKRADIILTKTADVWVTYVTEGAGWRNALGYYTYQVGNEPKTAANIEKLNLIFPNVSQKGSGGGLIPGDKVYLGRFNANTAIGWFLVADGWRSQEVQGGNGVHFSQPNFNKESTSSLRQHMVMLYDKSREQLILGFEDVPRDWSWCDDDFNDAIFYATANPISAVKMDNVSEITAANDSDGDGINDELDDFPFDPNKSFNNFAPSEGSHGTLAFEDLWPSKGDYDFNDCVVDYNFNLIANSKNKVSSIEATFKIAHIGGAHQNGFAFEIPISASKIENIEGQEMNVGYVSQSSNGTEVGQSNAVIFVTENVTRFNQKTITLKINLKSALNKSSLGSVPFNPFIVVNGEREREVHLADMAPTAKGAKYLGQDDDYSSTSEGRYYKSERNLPWALNIYDNFKVSPEKVSIDKTYPKFTKWANSGGTTELAWYQDK